MFFFSIIRKYMISLLPHEMKSLNKTFTLVSAGFETSQNRQRRLLFEEINWSCDSHVTCCRTMWTLKLQAGTCSSFFQKGLGHFGRKLNLRSISVWASFPCWVLSVGERRIKIFELCNIVKIHTRYQWTLFIQLVYSWVSRYHVATDSVAPFSAYKHSHNSQYSILQLHAWLPSLNRSEAKDDLVMIQTLLLSNVNYFVIVLTRHWSLWYKPCCFSNVNYFVIVLTRYWSLSQQGHLQPPSKSKAWQLST